MEYLIGIILALLGGLIFYKKKADNNAVDVKLAKTKGRDAELQVSQEEVESAIREIDSRIEEIKKEKKERDKDRKNLSLKERAEEAKKRYGR